MSVLYTSSRLDHHIDMQEVMTEHEPRSASIAHSQVAHPSDVTQGRGRGRRSARRGGRGPRQAGVRVQVPDAQRAHTDLVPRPVTLNARPRADVVRRGRNTRIREIRGSHPPRASGVIPARTFGGHLTSETVEEDTPMLSAEANAFVPGRPVVLREAKQPVARPREPPRARRLSRSQAPDLPTRIHEDIDSGNYECVVCSSEVTRNSKVWSCSTCWTVTHIDCAKNWHHSQAKKSDDADDERTPTWRCPGCNSTLTESPNPFHCWCGKEINPRSVHGLPPFSCGQSCGKTRTTCAHACTVLPCHAGPCPPCTLMGPVQTCFCGKKTKQQKCVNTNYQGGYSCEEVCGDLLPCGIHTCSKACHEGLCEGCEALVPSFCYCGKEYRELKCDEREDLLDSYNHGQVKLGSGSPVDKFEGAFTCDRPCDRPFHCGVHHCEKPCHPQDRDSAHCPFAPDTVTHCPCGKTPLADLLVHPRATCEDNIPKCAEVCGKTLSCGHTCKSSCHAGPCGMCVHVIDIDCRCGKTSSPSLCHQGNLQKPQCFRLCKAQLACNRHICGQRCCPAETAAIKRQAQSRSRKAATILEVEDEHMCLRQCDQLLRCGKHYHDDGLCHRGPCPPCLNSVFDEISCACGRTILQPPQPCGTQAPECRYACTRTPTCGHPRTEHNCHPDDVDCPKCPFLTEKRCVCGERTLKNQPCWFNEARCGLPCDRRLKCKLHNCNKTCHPDGECEDEGIEGSHCAQVCGRPRETCGHPCMDTCHEPHNCNESRPCQLEKIITCDCQRKRQAVKCLATLFNPAGPSRERSQCDEECAKIKRNRQLAEALSIDPATHTDSHVPYQAITLHIFKEDSAWAELQEKEMRAFADAKEQRYKRFKPMRARQRQFLHVLAEDYGIETESQDPEPHRHVMLFKGPGFVSAPFKTLAQCVRINRHLAASAKAAVAPATAAIVLPTAIGADPLNALLIMKPRFGLTIEEIDSALAADLRTTKDQYPALKNAVVSTSFLPADEVVIKATTKTDLASIAGQSTHPQSLEAALAALKVKASRTIAHLELASGGVMLCRIDDSLTVVHRDGDSKAAAAHGGWNRVAGKAAAKPRAFIQPGGIEARVPSHFLALKKPKKVDKNPVTTKPIQKGPEPSSEPSEPVQRDLSATAKGTEEDDRQLVDEEQAISPRERAR